MSASGFHAQFKAVTAMSPLQFQKHVRLQEARRLMFGEDLDATTAGRRFSSCSKSKPEPNQPCPPTASPKTKAAPMMKTLRRLLFGSSGGRALARRARRPGLVGVPHSGQNSASVGTRAPHCAQVTFAVSLRRER